MLIRSIFIYTNIIIKILTKENVILKCIIDEKEYTMKTIGFYRIGLYRVRRNDCNICYCALGISLYSFCRAYNGTCF